jgi:hypothetical protein
MIAVTAPASRPRRAGPIALAAALVACGAGEPGAAIEHARAPSRSLDLHVRAPVNAVMQVSRTLSYPYEQVWPTAIRYLRVDRGYRIADQNEGAGYVLFEFEVDDDRTGSGSLEIYRTEDAAGRASVRVAVSTGAGPAYLPNAIVDGLATKVRSERGQPAPPPGGEKPPEAPAEDPPSAEEPIEPNGPVHPGSTTTRPG